MCGFAGIARREPREIDPGTLARMGGAIRHRGPDGYGFCTSARVGLVHVRLSIIDLERGAQPLANEDRRLWLVFNGEIYNYVELRHELTTKGHTFRTRSDTEVIVHAYEEWGPRCLDRFNGEFSFAIDDRRDGTVFLARDRFGIRPLYYAIRDGSLLFGSEIKALLASGEVRAELSPWGMDEILTFWAARPPRTPFHNIWSLEPGEWARWREGRLERRRYYHLEFPEERELARPAEAVTRELNELMHSGIDLRMRSDVPVGGYLSGGLDSSITAAMASAASPYPLRTFSVTFADDRLDESRFQQSLVGRLGSRHRAQPIGAGEVAHVFPDVIRHTESPVVRTAPAPLYLLSRVTRDSGIKVVLTGEGADEVFLGYDLFKETLVRRFCLRRPDSGIRPLLFDRLYPYLDGGSRTGEFWRGFFLNSGEAGDPLFSHMPRFLLTSRIKEFYTAGMREGLADYDALQAARDDLPPAFERWSPLDRAAYLEFTTLLAPYLLSSQGDRMAMAHGVEGRVPFLDHRLVEFAAALPARSKLTGLREKVILRQWAQTILPRELAERPKQPYRAPDVPAFFGDSEPDYLEPLLAAPALAESGIFEPAAVAGLVRRCRAGRATGFRESQALVAILSTQIWFQHFVRGDNADVDWLVIEDADVMVSEAGEAASNLRRSP